MRKRMMTAATLAAFTAGVLASGQAPRTAEVRFKAAQHQEQVQGDLKGAIEQYKKITQGSDRALAAKALLAMGQCYEKLGQQESRAAYERVVREFADQAESADLARARLAALAPAAGRAQTARQIWTSNPSQDPSEGMPSPDGRYVSFTDWETGDLGLRDLSTGASRRLTNTGGWEASGDFAEAAAISQDGRQVAYYWFLEKESRSELRVISVNGGAPRTLLRVDVRDYMAPRGWTPDGRQLLVVQHLANGTSRVCMVAAQDGSVRVVKAFAWRNLDASLSPNGQYIAYDAPANDKTQAKDIFVLSADGSQETAVVQSPANDYAPLWSPDGARLLFLSDRTKSESLWGVPVVDGRATGPATLVKADLGNVRLLGLTRGGTLFYLPPGSFTPNLYTAELGADMKISKPPVLAVERYVNSNTGPAISSDGESLAYYSLRPSLRSVTLVIHNLKTGEEKDIPLPRPAAIFFGMGPKWFPDGRSLLMLLLETQKPGVGFYRLDLASGATELLQAVDQMGFQGFAFAPDGKAIYYTQGEIAADSSGHRLLRFDLESRQITELGKGRWFIAPTVSPDGKQIAYVVAVRPGSSSYVAVMPATGGPEREIFRATPWMDGSRYNTLAWTPDQRYLLFVRGGVGDNTPNVMWRVPVAGGPAEQVGLSVMGRIKSPQVHPDGRRIFFSASEKRPNEVWALENFLPSTVAAK